MQSVKHGTDEHEYRRLCEAVAPQGHVQVNAEVFSLLRYQLEGALSASRL
jgi:hypothetical protein